MLSVVVPVFNEVDSLATLHQQVFESVDAAGIETEIVFVDDGSTDGSWEQIAAIADNDDRVRGIRFRRNFGKAAALTAGMEAAGGELVMTMDADLQDDPAEIPNFLAKLDEGYDFINGWKERRLDPWHKVYPSKVFNWLVGLLTGLSLHDHNCGFKLMRANVTREIRLYGEFHRFLPVLADARGFKVAEIPVHHRRREHGHSKYGVRRFLKGFLDLLTITFLTSYRHRPQHILGGIGLFFLGIGFLGLGYLGIVWLLTNVFDFGEYGPIGSRPLLAYSIAATLLGGQALSLGLLAELIVAHTNRSSETYSVADRIRE